MIRLYIQCWFQILNTQHFIKARSKVYVKPTITGLLLHMATWALGTRSPCLIVHTDYRDLGSISQKTESSVSWGVWMDAAESVKRQLRDLSNKVQKTIQPVFTSRMLVHKRPPSHACWETPSKGARHLFTSVIPKNMTVLFRTIS